MIRSKGSHRILRNAESRMMLFTFHDRETVGPRMLARILKDAGITAEKLDA